MNRDENKNMQESLVEALRKLTEQMSTLTALDLAREFYSKSERSRLYAEYEGLLAEEKKAKRAVHEAKPKDGLSDEARIRMVGPEAAKEVAAPLEKANAAAQEIANKLFKFGMEHPTIVDIFSRKTKNAASR